MSLPSPHFHLSKERLETEVLLWVKQAYQGWPYYFLFIKHPWSFNRTGREEQFFSLARSCSTVAAVHFALSHTEPGVQGQAQGDSPCGNPSTVSQHTTSTVCPGSELLIHVSSSVIYWELLERTRLPPPSQHSPFLT